MIREVEKYFPLPLSYDAVRGEMKTYGGIVVMQPSLGLMSSEQAEYADDFARHLVQCANLMPTAVEVINELLPYCMHGQKRVRAERFLAKLEGGGGE